MSILSNSSSESLPVDVRSNIPAITTRDSEIDMNKGSCNSDTVSIKSLPRLLLKNVLKIMMMVMMTNKSIMSLNSSQNQNQSK